MTVPAPVSIRIPSNSTDPGVPHKSGTAGKFGLLGLACLIIAACGGGAESRLIDNPVSPAENTAPDATVSEPVSEPPATVSEAIQVFNGSWVTDCYRIDPAPDTLYYVITRYVFEDGRFKLLELTFEDSRCATQISSNDLADAQLVITGTATSERFLIDPVFGVEARVVELAAIRVQSDNDQPTLFANPSIINELMYRSDDTLYIGDRQELDGGGRLKQLDWEFPFRLVGPPVF